MSSGEHMPPANLCPQAVYMLYINTNFNGKTFFGLQSCHINDKMLRYLWNLWSSM